MADRELALKITAKNMSQAEFVAAQKQVKDLGFEVEDLGKKEREAEGFSAALGSKVTEMAAAFSAASIVNKVVDGLLEFGKAAIESAGHLVDLNVKTGISLEGLQRMDFVAKQTGTTVDAYAQAIFKMGINTAQGADSTRKAVKDMGMSWDDFKAKSPEQQFNAIIENIGKLGTEGERNAALVGIFGKGVSDAVAGMVDDYARLAAGATIASDAQIKAVDAAGDAWDAFKSKLSTGIVSILGDTVIAMQHATTSLGSFANFLKNASTMGLAWAVDNEAVIGTISAMKGKFDDLNVSEREWIKTRVDAGVSLKAIGDHFKTNSAEAMAYAAMLKGPTKDAHEDLVAQLKRINEDTDGLTAVQKANIAAGVAANKNTKEISDATGVAAEVVDMYKDRLTKSGEAAKKTAEENQKMKDVFDRINGSTQLATQYEYDRIVALKALNVSQGDIAASMRLAPGLVQAVINADKSRTDSAKSSDKLMKEIDLDYAKRIKKNAADQRALDDEATKRRADMVNDVTASNDRLSLQGRAGLDQQLTLIDQQESAERKANLVKGSRDLDLWKQIDANSVAYYQHQRDLANGTAGTIEERMAAQGVYTKTQQQSTVDALKKNYDQMVTSGKYTYEQLQQAEQRWRDASNELNNQTFNRIMKGFDNALNIADAFGKSVGGVFGDIISKGVDVAKSVEGIATSWLKGDWIGVAMQGIGLLGKAIGGIFGTAGRDAVEKFADTFDGGFDGLHKELSALGTQGEQLWISLTQGVGKNDPDAAKRVIDQITKALKDQKDQADATAAADAAALASFTDAQGKISGALTLVAGKVKSQADQHDYWTKQVKETSDAYTNLLHSGSASSAELKDAADAAANAQMNLQNVVVTSQDEFDRLARISLNTFNTLVASGKSPVEAMASIGDSVDALIDNTIQFGIKGGDAFASLSRWRSLTTDNKALLDQIGGLNDLMTMTGTLGGLTQDAFSDMSAQGVDAYNQLVKAGMTQQEAETAEAPLLQSIIKQHKEKGYAIDEATQKLIDQATQDGILSKEQMSTNDILQQGLGEVIKLLGGQIPEAWDTMATSAKVAADKVKTDATDPTKKNLKDVSDKAADPVAWDAWQKNAEDAADKVALAISDISQDVNVHIGYSYDSQRNTGVNGGSEHEVPMAVGGILNGPMRARIESGRREITGDVSFMTQALTGALGRVGSAGVASVSGGGGVPISVVVQAWDAQSVQTWLRNGGDAVLAAAVYKKLPKQSQTNGDR